MAEVQVTDFKTKKINELTGGKIATHKFSGGILENSFVSKKGEYIGEYGRGWWYVKQGMKVCDDYPHGCAEVWEKGKLVGYYGYTHRGGCLFRIGDKLFESSYKPSKKDYYENQWKKFEQEWEKSAKSEVKRGYAETIAEAKRNNPISDVVPFKMRGRKTIATMADAKKAAINMSKYL